VVSPTNLVSPARRVEATAVAQALTFIEEAMDAIEGHTRHLLPDDVARVLESRLLLRQSHAHLNTTFLSMLAQGAARPVTPNPATEA